MTTATLPELRACLVPGCPRRYEMVAALTGQPPARPGWTVDGWRHTSIINIFGCSVCPDHDPLVTAHQPSVQQPVDGLWRSSCACGTWAPDPVVVLATLRPLWEQHVLTVSGALPKEV
ncbi:hypothetical protein [Streptomyces sp. 8L]|uniref:hypothetical protein n=1 Tax=Streptomyces sp. 8L TaxID=2877242 RepID=UPI001CD3CA49|nr:hypothetical protein [Streptomyces sp. 8L]MCA1222445.1 hypothetical protein [Streptomyces sp. 8L]